jgi:hypothetical protein
MHKLKKNVSQEKQKGRNNQNLPSKIRIWIGQVTNLLINLTITSSIPHPLNKCIIYKAKWNMWGLNIMQQLA